MTILEVSLSRAHKVAERLKDLVKETLAEVETQSQASGFSSRPAPSALEDLSGRALRVLALADKASVYSKAWVTVRSVIASENNKRGIDKMLADLEMINKLTVTYKQLVTHSKAAGHLPAEAASYIPEGTTYGYGLTVNPMREPSVVVKITAKLASLQREAIQLSDAIAEANAPRVQLQLSEDIVNEVTGVVKEG